MDAGAVLQGLLVSAVGLLAGSVLPADLLARSQGVDIRGVGDGNPGTVNAFRGLGLGYGLLTAAYDVSVGVVVILAAERVGVTEGWAYLAGIMTVVGHRFPVFAGFRGGGEGMGASTGMLLYGIGLALTRGWLTAVELGILVAILAGALVLTRSDRVASLAMLPVLILMLTVARVDWRFLAFMTAIAANMWLVQFFDLARERSGTAAGPVRRHARQ